MIEVILDHLASQSDVDALGVEVRSHGRASTDICVLQGGELIGIEAKLSDWKRAVAQAYLNRHCVDRSYIAVWSDVVSLALCNAAEQYQIGVLGVDLLSLDLVLAAPLSSPSVRLRCHMVDRIASGKAVVHP